MDDSYLKTVPIDISQREQIENLRLRYGHYLSSHAFVSIYLWQKNMGLSLYLCENMFSVKCTLFGENTWFFPCGDETAARDFIKRGMEKEDFKLCYLRDRDVKWLNENFPGKWEILRSESDDEYIGNICEYTEMKGKHFSGIRHKINRIEREHVLRTEVISESNIEDVYTVGEKWGEITHHESKDGLTDDGIFSESISMAEVLGISGTVTYSDGAACAVFAGFDLGGDTVDVIIGKTLREAPSGMMYYALREYLKMCGKEYTYYNAEEDMGIEGIRMVKNNLRPERKNEMWEAVII